MKLFEALRVTQAIADQLGCRIGDVIQAEWVAAVLSNADMGLKGVPERARVIGLINAVGDGKTFTGCSDCEYGRMQSLF
jgi:hypothetical protein